MLNLPPDELRPYVDGQAPAPHLDIVAALSFRAAGAALRLGVFDHLGDLPLPADDLAKVLSADPRGVGVLLDALVGFGYATRDADGYRATPAAAWLGTGYRPAFSFWHRVVFEQWTALEDSLRTGAPAVDFYGWLAADPDALAEFQSMLGGLADAVAPEVVPALPPGTRRLLDLGGGHARHATALCAAHPDLRADIVDLPGSLEAGRAHAAEAGVADRVAFREADWLTDELGTGYDTVLLFNVLHGLAPDRARELLLRVSRAVRPGGAVLVLEETTAVPAEAGAVGAAWVPASSLNLFHTQGGQLYAPEQLSGWLTEAGFAEPSTAPIAPAPTFTLFTAVKTASVGRALSVTQRQMLAFDRLHPESTWYTVPLTVRVTGPLDVDRLRGALDRVWQRHEALRSTHTEDAVLPCDPPVLREVSASSDAELHALRATLLRTRFDLSTEPPVRATLISLPDGGHELVVITHHIATDGFSLTVLRQDILDGYATPGLEAGEARRPEVVADHDAQLDFWRTTLADLPEPLELPFVGARGHDLEADAVPFRLPDEVTARVRDLARDQRSSPFMVLLTAFGVLLGRLSGARDLVIGTPVAGRDEPGADRVVDCLVNMVALRLRLAGATTWADALGAARSTALDAVDNADVPFARVVDEVVAVRSPQVHPVFQVVFAAPPALPGPATVDGVGFDFRDGTSTESLFDIEVQVFDEGDALRGYLKYRTARFDRAPMAGLVEQFTTLLGQIDPAEPVADARLLTPEQRHRAVVEWNDTATGYPRDATLAELVESRVDSAPDAVATVYGDRVLTYRELDDRANGLARALLAQGIGVEDRVGLCLGFGPGWAIAALAVVKAGAVYVPLDPAYPAARLDHMCADSGVRVVIAEGALGERFSAPVIDPDSTGASGERPRVDVRPENLAYVMYTSGSTGQPKGVGVTHRNVVRLVRDTNYVDIRPGDGFAQAANQSFDAATLELWGPLCAGARLVGVPKDDLVDPAALAATLRAGRVDLMFLTTSLARQVAATAPETFACLRQLLFGGEQADPATVNRLLTVPGLRVTNGYGPTETTTFGLFWHAEPVAEDEVVPVGRPIANSTAYVLDDHLEPVAPGVVGEIHLGGDGVARGYLGNPALTDERFIPDPFGGGRLYRTGDLGRYRPDGLIECLGRADRQLKVRGFRVEPAEVENALRATGRVRDTTVQLRDGELLVAYAVPTTPGDPLADLRDALRERLPDHLVPAVVVPMNSLPTNPNGKLDVAALPAPGAPPTAAAEEPATDLERALRDIWREVLDNPDLGLHDDFFQFGGHSIKAGQVIARIRQALRIPVSLRHIFDNPTVAGLAAALPARR